MAEPSNAITGFHARSGVPSQGYIAATKPRLEKAADGKVHPTPEDAFTAIEAMGEAGAAFNVYEVLVHVSPDPMPPAMKVG